VNVDRGFARIAEGLVHYRRAGAPDRHATRPLWMMHASPASSLSLVPLMLELAGSRPTLAPDTLGFGDSAPPARAEPDVAYYADAFLRALDALGIEAVDLYGFHTGAHIAIEMALARPGRVGRIVLDGLLVLDDAERGEFLEHYAPPLVSDAHGTQVFQALGFIRDQAWFFPHFRRDAAHNLGGGAMPPAVLHMLTVDLLKAAQSYHLAYRAVFRHAVLDRVALLPQPAYLVADEADPTRHGLAAAAARLAGARHETLRSDGTASSLCAKAARIAAFLDATGRPGDPGPAAA
jgi:pimeloyl-ACP methyl ester carboxylesterase